MMLKSVSFKNVIEGSKFLDPFLFLVPPFDLPTYWSHDGISNSERFKPRPFSYTYIL